MRGFFFGAFWFCAGAGYWAYLTHGTGLVGDDDTQMFGRIEEREEVDA